MVTNSLAAGSSAPPYRLLALDVDGTLVHDGLVFSPRLRQAVAGAVARGVFVTVATGRMFCSALPIARMLGFNAPLVCYNGALVQPLDGTPTLYHEPVPLELARDLVAFAQASGIHINVYVDDALHVARLSEEALYAAKIAGVDPVVKPDLLGFLQAAPTKLVLITTAEASGPLAETIRARYGDQLHVTRSLARYVEVVHPAVSKWRSLAYLAEHLGVRREAIIAVGDSFNDAEMLDGAGLGVVMGNAPDVLKARAGYVAPSVTEDGVAHVIEHFLLR